MVKRPGEEIDPNLSTTSSQKEEFIVAEPTQIWFDPLVNPKKSYNNLPLSFKRLSAYTHEDLFSEGPNSVHEQSRLHYNILKRDSQKDPDNTAIISYIRALLKKGIAKIFHFL